MDLGHVAWQAEKACMHIAGALRGLQPAQRCQRLPDAGHRPGLYGGVGQPVGLAFHR